MDKIKAYEFILEHKGEKIPIKYRIHIISEHLHVSHMKEKDIENSINGLKGRIGRLQTEIDKLKEDLDNKKAKCKTDLEISADEPELISAVIVIPSKDISGDKKDANSKRYIELKGMKVALDYEKTQGRTPEDVSGEFRGYDIESIGDNDVRYIEVKGFKRSGDIEMTMNEWISAIKYQNDYWLYVVEYATNPSETVLTPIQNPSEEFKFDLMALK